MTVELLTKQHLEFLSLSGGCTGSSGSALVKIPHCWRSHVAAHILIFQVHGHTKISILDGGLHRWEEDNYRTTSDSPEIMVIVMSPKGL